MKGVELDGVCYLRTDAEAVEIQQRLELAHDIVVIGGGFIGLELAAAARTLGKSVRVLELQSRLMPRVVSPILSDFYRDLHTGQGVEISLGVELSEIAGHQGKVSGVVLADGTVCPADLVLIGIGVIPNMELALDAGTQRRERHRRRRNAAHGGPQHLRHRRLRRSPKSVRESISRWPRPDRIRAECG